MATTTTSSSRTLPTPPPVPSYPLPSPSKKDTALKPNPHPYAIKTTSTALLTRSNSSGYNVNATYHYYIPSSPSPNRSDSGRSHRPSKSLTSVNIIPESPSHESPRPLPIPPALESPTFRRDGSGGSGGYVSADDAASMRLRRPKRSETLPIIPIPSPKLTAPTPSVDDLPDNPKLWTPSQLATYLTAALRMTSNGKPGEIEPIGLPALVAKDIAAFVKNARIGGRMFMRLNEEDLESLGMNKKWRDALLTAARNLRQNVLKGRIWGAEGSPATSPSPESASPPKFFSNPDLNSSSSSIESSASLSAGEHESGSPGAALGRSKARRYRNGRVRGMVETFERSGSFSSDGGVEEGEDGPADERAHLRRWARQAGKLNDERVTESPSSSPSRRRPLPVPPSPSGSSHSRMGALEDEEPSMEALLAEMEHSQPMTGARAWEEMDLAAGITVKRIPSGGDAPAPMSLEAVPQTTLGSRAVVGLGSGKSSGGSSKGKNERRVVTAIFAPNGSATTVADSGSLKPLESTAGLETFADAPLPPIPSPDRQQQSRPLPPTPDDPTLLDAPPLLVSSAVVPEPELPESIAIERLLEEEIMVTRALLDTFRARLEIVEHKVADLEVKEAERAREQGEFRAAADARKQQSGSVEIGVQSVSVSAGAGVVEVLETQASSSQLAAETPSDLVSGDIVPLSSSSQTSEEKVSAVSLSTSASASAPCALQSVIPEVVRRLHAHAPTALLPSSSSAVTGKHKEEEREGEVAKQDQPANVADLPSYVLLVGLGVCAVVIQVVLKKVVGKGAGFRP